ncbi:MAG TPA: hypoxanthine phosphoribosyltransferase [Bacteroidales bacterium]
MSQIQIHDKQFETFITSDKLDRAILELAGKLNAELDGKTPVFLAVLNGSFMFASDLLKKITIPCEISFVKLASYAGTTSTQHVRELIGFDENIKGRTVVVLEDIIDSGITLQKVLEKLKALEVGEIIITTLLFKPEAFKMSFDIDFIGIEIPNDFIVGYGLDYDKQGRNLKDIYKIVE